MDMLCVRDENLDSEDDCPFEIVFEAEPSPDTQASEEKKEEAHKDRPRS